MVFFSFMSNQDLAASLITLAGQSILVSLIGIGLIKIVSGRSAPVRSLFCIATIIAMGLVVVISTGLRLSGISWSQTTITVIGETGTADGSMSFEPGTEIPSVPMSPLILTTPTLPSISVNDRSALVPTLYSGHFSLPFSFFINIFGYIWLIGLLFQLSKLGYGVVLVKKFRNSLKDTSEIPFSGTLRNIAGTFWKYPLPELRSSSLIESPITIGLFKPTVIIPEKLLYSLNENERKSILLHELAHIYHNDQVIGLLKRIAIAFHWWNPLIYKMNRDHEQAREEVSDNYVLMKLNPRIYTQCLMNLAEKVCLISNFPTAAGMAGRRFDLRARVEQILSRKRIIALKTNFYLKAISFSFCFAITFSIAGLHARIIKMDAQYDSEKDLNKIMSFSIPDEYSLLSPTTALEPEEIEKPESINSRSISKAVAFPQTESSNKQTREVVNFVSGAPDTDIAADEKSATKSDSTNFQSDTDNLSKKQAREVVTPMIAMVSDDIDTDKKVLKNVDPAVAHSVQDSGLNHVAENHDVLPLKEAALKNESDAAEFYHNGVSSLKIGEVKEAIAKFSKAINLDPTKAVVYAARGSAYFRMDQFDDAIDDYNTAIMINPGLAAAFQNRGSVYYRQGRFNSAITDYNKAIEIDPEQAASYIDRGNIYQRQGRIEEAISDYSRALELNPEDSETYTDRGIAYYSKEEYQKASLDFNRAIDLDPASVSAYIYRGYYYQIKGEYRKAVTDFSKALLLNPDVGVADKLRNEIARASKKGKLKNSVTGNKQKLVCRYRALTGTLLKEKICTTKTELDSASASAQELVRKIQKASSNGHEAPSMNAIPNL